MKSEYPSGWDEARLRAVLDHYERQTEDEAVAEYEAALARRAARSAQKRAGKRVSEVAERPGKYDANQQHEADDGAGPPPETDD